MKDNTCPPFCDCDDLTECECKLTDEENDRLDAAQRWTEQRGG